jgi:hypothetical protein
LPFSSFILRRPLLRLPSFLILKVHFVGNVAVVELEPKHQTVQRDHQTCTSYLVVACLIFWLRCVVLCRLVVFVSSSGCLLVVLSCGCLVLWLHCLVFLSCLSLVLSCLVSCLVLSYLVLSCLALPCLALSFLVLSCLVLSRPVLSGPVWSGPVWSDPAGPALAFLAPSFFSVSYLLSSCVQDMEYRQNKG